MIFRNIKVSITNATVVFIVLSLFSCKDDCPAVPEPVTVVQKDTALVDKEVPKGPVTAFYGGGIMYKEQNRAAVIEELKSSGLNTIIVWTIHIEENGDLGFNGEFDLVKDGVYVGDDTHPSFRSDIQNLKIAPTSINRVEFGLAAAGSGTFNNVRAFMGTEGFGEGTTLYKNFKALQEAIPEIDAFNNDDEVTYHAESAIAFTKMLAKMGYKNAIVPYRENAFWKQLVEEVNAEYPGNIDRNYLQCYAGGGRNNPCSSEWDFGIDMIPGLWGGPSGISPSAVIDQMDAWRESCDIEGGFLWDYEKFALDGDTRLYVRALQP
jgi:hypothetical protein